jgi:hypothetical protein
MQGNYCPKNDVMLLIMVIKLDQGKHKRRQQTQEIWYLVETTSSKWTISISRVKMFAINQSVREKKYVESNSNTKQSSLILAPYTAVSIY